MSNVNFEGVFTNKPEIQIQNDRASIPSIAVHGMGTYELQQQ